MSVIIIQIQIQKQADTVVSGTSGLLISGFGSSTRGEKRHNSYNADHP